MYIKELGIEVGSIKLSDIDKDLLKESIDREAKGILNRVHYNDEDHRSDATVKRDISQGHAAEVGLRQFYDFENDEDDYMDVKYNGMTVDVKTSKVPFNEVSIKKLQDDLYKKRLKGLKVADYVFAFDYDIVTETYTPSAFVPVKQLTPDMVTALNKPRFKKIGPSKTKPVKNAEALFYGLKNRGKSEKDATDIMYNMYGYKVLY